ncbi:MAG: sugar phosphate isomerase/epimerase [Methylobacteriaceae bacterium]|nr:sugar phosphate isomerase/epimerase [Methylobacteriaceae bacterium]
MAPTDPLSIQLYSARKFPPLDRQLQTIKECGFTNVETFGGLYDDLPGLKAGLDRHGLTAKSGHFPLAMVEGEPQRVLDIAGALGISTIIPPFLPPAERPVDRFGWAAVGERLAGRAACLHQKGLRLAWHNHDFEFKPLPDGSFPIEYLLANGVLWEADIAWIIKAGVDPMVWLERYPDRIRLIHVKDIAPAGENENEDGWADVGAGSVGWSQLWRYCVAAGTEIMVAEHDNPSDFERFARVSAATMRDFAGRGAR